MTETYFPFDAGAGSDVRESQWREMARLWRGSGVISGILNSLEVYADSTGMQVKVKTGEAWVDGFKYKSDAEIILAVASAHPTYGRIDRVVVRLDVANNIISAAVVTGTPAASPAIPALTQITTGIWEIPLAKVTVDAGAVTIAAGKVTDDRTYSYAATAGALGTADYDSGWFAVTGNPTVTYTKAHGLGVTPRLIILMHSAVAAPGSSDDLIVINSVVAGGSAGWQPVRANATNILVTTGAYAGISTVYSQIRSSDAGYWRIQAWR